MSTDITVSAAKKPLRDRLQLGIYKIINPFVRLLIKIGFTPNKVTTTGLILNIGVAIIFIIGAEEGNRGELEYVGWAGALILFAGLFDMLDGQVARLGNMKSTFGAMYDSVLDRYSEMVMFLGICYYLVGHHYFLSSLFAFIALIGSMMVSYTRARAEGLGIECKGGVMQRPERVVLIGVTALACGITSGFIGGDYKLFIPGIRYHVFETMTIFTLPIAVMAVLTNITAVRRLLDSKKALDRKDALESANKSKPLASKMLVVLAMIGAVMVGSVSKTTAAALNSFTYEKAIDVSFDDEFFTPDGRDSFPVPTGNPKQLFYLQRDPNTNTVVYELKYDKNGKLDENDPIHVFWIRYPEGGMRKDLNYIQRKFAYGVKGDLQKDGRYKLTFAAYKKKALYLAYSEEDHKHHIYTTLNNKNAILERVYIKIDPDGTFWAPNVRYIEMKGKEVGTNNVIVERITIK
jgi:phosphatidylglycerophosphate synthase